VNTNAFTSFTHPDRSFVHSLIRFFARHSIMCSVSFCLQLCDPPPWCPMCGKKITQIGDHAYLSSIIRSTSRKARVILVTVLSWGWNVATLVLQREMHTNCESPSVLLSAQTCFLADVTITLASKVFCTPPAPILQAGGSIQATPAITPSLWAVCLKHPDADSTTVLQGPTAQIWAVNVGQK
jgi:hypothetical protein